jgi:hypothetical protein
MTAFDDWLRALAAAGKGGASVTDAEMPAATRGLAWSLPIVLPGDWTGAVMVGAIRSTPDATTALATFTMTGPTYDAGAGTSTWTAALAAGTGANSTEALPADTDGDGITELPASFLITPSGGAQELLFGAKFTVLGKV